MKEEEKRKTWILDAAGKNSRHIELEECLQTMTQSCRQNYDPNIWHLLVYCHIMNSTWVMKQWYSTPHCCHQAGIHGRTTTGQQMAAFNLMENKMVASEYGLFWRFFFQRLIAAQTAVRTFEQRCDRAPTTGGKPRSCCVLAWLPALSKDPPLQWSVASLHYTSMWPI